MTKKYTSTYDKLCKGQNKSLKHPTWYDFCMLGYMRHLAKKRNGNQNLEV